GPTALVIATTTSNVLPTGSMLPAAALLMVTTSAGVAVAGRQVPGHGVFVSVVGPVGLNDGVGVVVGVFGVTSSPQITLNPACMRSEERRVGKECRARWLPYL